MRLFASQPGAGAAGLAALLVGSLPELKDRAVVLLLSGATSIPLLIAGSSSEGILLRPVLVVP
jgi:hypothetical protein